jgi:hypothetical protein
LPGAGADLAAAVAISRDKEEYSGEKQGNEEILEENKDKCITGIPVKRSKKPERESTERTEQPTST